MSDDTKNFVTSALIGVAGFLASHAFARIEKKGDSQGELEKNLALVQEQLKRLDEDFKELRKSLEIIRDRISNWKRRDDDDE